MKIFAYFLLWLAIYLIALTIRLLLDSFLDDVEMSRIIIAIIKAIPNVILLTLGFALQKKLRVYFNKRL